ncbi:hypothetical protein RU86_GL001410 [Lactococcus piscium]|uniref:Uncharacterized protein n=1 Tax=Pseudolactococcus piscium TaxID=1364 RepID=A0A2A5RUP0_9LACT|nr:hypothetical protein [Lactococcus piscium]PCS04678.1 hypothetical protein RU86_GL001410 [Lactococcus piscium]
MKLFEKFKKKAQVKHKINHSDEDIIADIFKKLKLNKNIILKISENKGLAVFKGDFQNQERLYIQIFSSIISTRGEENEYFAEVDFDYLVTIFEDHPDIAFAVLDIFDEKPIYYPRNAFTNRYIIKKIHQ